MKQTINFCQFTDAFRDHGREGSFSYNGKKALYEWIESFEDDTGAEVELDVIALDCEFCEYDSLESVADEYGYEPEDDDDLDDDEKEELLLEWLSERTQVIEFDGGVIIQSF